jgi:hypothetical protein
VVVVAEYAVCEVLVTVADKPDSPVALVPELVNVKLSVVFVHVDVVTSFAAIAFSAV